MEQQRLAVVNQPGAGVTLRFHTTVSGYRNGRYVTYRRGQSAYFRSGYDAWRFLELAPQCVQTYPYYPYPPYSVVNVYHSNGCYGPYYGNQGPY